MRPLTSEETGSVVRSLAVVRALVPVPTSGGEIRVHHLLRALAEIGDLDVVRTRDWWDDAGAEQLQPSWGDTRILVPRTRRVPGWRGHARWVRSPGLPSSLGFVDRATIRSAFAEWRRPDYDVVLFDPPDGWSVLGEAVRAPEIVDIDDLRDVVAARTLAMGLDPARDATGPTPGRWRGALRRRRVRGDGRRWRRYQDRVAGQAAAVLLASEVDRRRSGYPNGVVVPNGYELQTPPVGRTEPGDPPTFVFPGRMTYTPNEDGAEHFVREIFPIVRASLPGARLVIAGAASERVLRLAAPPEIRVTGWVDNMEDVLALADVVVVPLRIGGGTRIKIIEAWAHGIPVVSTAVGAEGLEAEAGRDVLIADDAADFARSCIAAATDRSVRATLTDAGRARAADLTWSAARQRLQAVARDVISSRTAG